MTPASRLVLYAAAAAALANLAMLKRVNALLTPGARRWLNRRLMADRYHPRTRQLAELFWDGMLVWKNSQYSFAENGEAALLRQLARFAPAVVIDAGANVGEWSLAALATLPDALVHAFEIVAPTAAALERNTVAFRDRIVVNAVGLADREGEITVYTVPDISDRASTLPDAMKLGGFERIRPEVVEVTGRITTGDAYVRQHGIAKIDFLKIDVEGAELAVLQGFAEAFDRQAIDIVQFEYGTINLRTRHLLEDFYRFFTERGFEVGKLYPEGVAFKPFEPADEDFVGPNYIACHRRRRDIIDAIRCPPLSFVPPTPARPRA